jgi:asparagine synthase (glutamine-hydrolysing)
MCGIAGIALRHTDRDLRVRFERLAREHLSRRGPDAFNSISLSQPMNGSVDLHHARLSIIDVEGGVQPMSSSLGTLVYNGEIYNFNEVADPRINYRTRSDTEVLLHGLGHDPFRFLNSLEGMFAFGYLDEQNRKLIVARDSFGIKPVYIFKSDKAFAFASSLHPLMALSRKEINPQALVEYYSARGMRGSNTIFRDIIEVAPGYAFVLDLDTWHVSSTKWAQERPILRRTGSEADLAAELDEIMDRSVRKHLISDVPVATLLSGGIDSSLVTALAARHAPGVAAFTMGFHDKRYDESEFAALLARKYGLKHHVVHCEDRDFIDLIDQWPLVMDDAVANPSTVLLHAISSHARAAGHKVLLAGEGADELFGGYHQQWRFQLARKLHTVGRFAPCLPGWIERFAPHKTRLIHAARMTTSRCAFHGTSTIFEPHTLESTFAVRHRAAPRAKTLHEALQLDQKYRLPDDMLTAADRATMHASVEARVPFVTQEVADFAAGLPEEMLISGFTQKVLLRKVARKYVPAACIDRRKVGFDLPLSRWFRTTLKDRLFGALNNSWQKEFFRPGALERVVGWHMEGKADMPDKLWAFMLLENNVRALRAIH